MVRYADSPSTSVVVEIAAPTPIVWPHLCDINVPGSFSEEFERAEWIDPGPKLGATFRGFNRHEVVGEWNVVCTVTALESERVFEWTVGDVDFKAARWRFDLEPTEGGSTLRFSAEMGPAPSGLTPAIERMPDREEDIVARRLSEWTDNMRRTIEGIRGLAEASAEAAAT
ncbi:MAG: SRPBCC family protein [Acidimicrobiales bacterium]